MTISARTVAKVILTAVGVSAGLYALWLIRGVILLVFIAVFLAVALGPAVDFFERRLRARRIVAIGITYLCLLLGVAVIGLLVVPPIVEQTAKFIENVPEYVDTVGDNEAVRDFDEEYGITEELREQADTLPRRFGDAASTIQSIVVGVVGAVFSIVTVLVLAFFLLLDGRRLFEWIIGELGPVRGPRWRAVADDVYRSVGGYVVGAMTIALTAGVASYLMMTVLGIPFAVPLAVLAAFFSLIPLVGATIAGTIIAIVAALGGDFPTDLVIWVVFFVVYQQFENNLLQPQIFRRTVALHPLTVIVGLLIGASLLGIVGALLAIPIAGALQIVVKDWWAYRRDTAPALAPTPAIVVPGDGEGSGGDQAGSAPPASG
jgi:predicted PurR-regulated permease PerM